MTWAGAAGHLDSLLPKQAWEQICKCPRVGQVFFGESVAGVGVGGTCQKLLLLGAAQAQSPRELPCDYTPRPQPPALNRRNVREGHLRGLRQPPQGQVVAGSPLAQEGTKFTPFIAKHVSEYIIIIAGRQPEWCGPNPHVSSARTVHPDFPGHQRAGAGGFS
jgi:hypothetical protein